MKKFLLIFLFGWLLVSCGREESSPVAGSLKTFSSSEPGQFIPPMDKICKGDFDPVGMAAAFEAATGFLLPPEIHPVEGRYVVADEGDGEGKFRRYYWLYFSTTPERSVELLSAIEAHWRKTYLSKPDWEIQIGKISGGGGKEGPFHFSDKSEGIVVCNPYDRYREAYKAIIDPASGNIRLYSYTGMVEDPRERVQPE